MVQLFKKKNQVAPYWFMFDDLLVYCETKKKPDEKLFDFKASIPISTISSVEEVKPEDKKIKDKECAFSVRIENERWIFRAKTQKEKTGW